MEIQKLAWAGVLCVCVGCATAPLRPAANAVKVNGRDQAAQAGADGVRVIADGDAWRGEPRDLRAVVPVKVSLENGGEVPLRVRYGDFVLVLPQGIRLAALPPMEIRGTEVVNSPGYAGISPGFAYRGFWGAPYYRGRGFYRGLSLWSGPFAYDPFYYQSYYQRWPVQLPTGDMLAKALPEGVIQAGGHLSGFLYFQPIPEGNREVSFQAELVNGDTGESFGKVNIPFIARD